MMKKNSLIFLITAILFASGCTDKKSAENILSRFIDENIPDRRELVFEVSLETKGTNLILSGETDSEVLKESLLQEFREYNIIDRISLLPDSTVGEKRYGLINLSVANLRVAPSHTAELATQALMGTPIKILKKKGGWFLAQTPCRYIAWIDNDGIFPIEEDKLNKWKKSRRALITAEYEFLYSCNTDGIISDLAMGNVVEISGDSGSYFLAYLPDGRHGVIPEKNCMDFSEFKENATPDVVSLVQLAKSFTGRPYLWGGISTRALDCSGFTKLLYFMHGVILARDASLQAKYGLPVAPSENFDNFEPGDLLFFGADSGRITHVALSLGGSRYIHASGMVKENSFDPGRSDYSESRRNSFIGCRRVTGMEGAEGIQWIKEHPWY